MAATGWYDTGKGYMANDVISKKIRYALQSTLGYMDAARPEPGSGKGVGDTVEFLKTYDIDPTLEGAQAIAEKEPIPESDLDRDKGSIVVREYGRSVPLTELFLTLSTFNPKDLTSRALRDHMARVLNRLAATAIKRTRVKYTPTGTAGSPTATWDTDGTLSTAATRNLQMWDVIQIRDYAVDVLHMQPINGGAGNYLFKLILPSAVRSEIINDDLVSRQIESAYSGSKQGSPFANGSLPVWQGVALAVDNQETSTGKLGNTNYLGAGVFYGDDAVAYSMPTRPEIRMKTGKYAGDYGRDQGVAWYGIMGFSLTRGDTAKDITANSASAIEITST